VQRPVRQIGDAEKLSLLAEVRAVERLAKA
jgi:hypothetical protein